jgi:hypothetical protein
MEIRTKLQEDEITSKGMKEVRPLGEPKKQDTRNYYYPFTEQLSGE